MAKKVECIKCDNSMDWSIPKAEVLKGNEHLQYTLKNTILCGHTMKTKTVNHCQYCKHYEHEENFRQQRRERYEKQLEQALAEMKGV